MARCYVWDKTEALAFSDRVIRHVMDVGTLADVLAMERVLGRDRLVAALRITAVGGMRPRSWWFWHYRVGLTDAAHVPPPMPRRCLA